jgi:hypothetical protein
MNATAHLNQTIVIRSSRYLSVILFCIAPAILLFGVMDLIPSMQGYDPHTGLLLCGGALAVAIVGILLLNYRPPKVYLTPLELQLPGYGIPKIPWSDIVGADVFEVHARGTVLYLGILLTDSARRNFTQPAPMKALKVLVNLAAHASYDVLLHCDMLEWSPQRLADAINLRASAPATAVAANDII